MVKIDPRTDIVSEVGDLVVVPGAIRGNRFKWLRGARSASGDMFGIPCNANKVRVLDALLLCIYMPALDRSFSIECRC